MGDYVVAHRRLVRNYGANADGLPLIPVVVLINWTQES